MSKTRPPYPAAFRQQMVELVRSGRTPGDLAREFEPSAQAIRTWVAQADRDAGTRNDGLRTEELEEVRRLRREVPSFARRKGHPGKRRRRAYPLLSRQKLGDRVSCGIAPRGATVSLLEARPRGKRGPRTPADLQVVTPGCDPV